MKNTDCGITGVQQDMAEVEATGKSKESLKKSSEKYLYLWVKEGRETTERDSWKGHRRGQRPDRAQET